MTFEEILVLQYAITHLTSHKKGEIRGFSAVHPFYTSTVKTEISNLNDCIICQDWLRTIITLIHTPNTFYLFWSCILFIPNTSSSPFLYSAPPTQFFAYHLWILASVVGTRWWHRCAVRDHPFTPPTAHLWRAFRGSLLYPRMIFGIWGIGWMFRIHVLGFGCLIHGRAKHHLGMMKKETWIPRSQCQKSWSEGCRMGLRDLHPQAGF